MGPTSPASVTQVARPFLKWVGGKRQLLGAIESALPPVFRNYYEPFLGGGAVFFRFGLPNAFLGDVNEELIQTYSAVRDQPEELIELLKLHADQHNEPYYYKVRALDPATLGPLQSAARLIYLNRTCYNGLYRVNRKGQFNVPIGSYRSPVICDADNLRAVSAQLAEVTLHAGHYADLVRDAGRGDFVYFDPPYQPLSTSASFVSYSARGFGQKEQIELAEVFSALANRGVLCMLSNSSTPFIRDLYRQHNLRIVQAGRAVNSAGSRRGKIDEVLVTSYG